MKIVKVQSARRAFAEGHHSAISTPRKITEYSFGSAASSELEVRDLNSVYFVHPSWSCFLGATTNKKRLLHSCRALPDLKVLGK
jgi:hypothetical protein